MVPLLSSSLASSPPVSLGSWVVIRLAFGITLASSNRVINAADALFALRISRLICRQVKVSGVFEGSWILVEVFVILEFVVIYVARCLSSSASTRRFRMLSRHYSSVLFDRSWLRLRVSERFWSSVGLGTFLGHVLREAHCRCDRALFSILNLRSSLRLALTRLFPRYALHVKPDLSRSRMSLSCCTSARHAYASFMLITRSGAFSHVRRV